MVGEVSPGTSTAGAWLQAAMAQLQATSDSPRTDAEWLLAAVLNIPRTQLALCRSAPLDAAQRQRAEALLARRSRGEPVAYLLGCWEFWSLPLAVTPSVLVPRPETESVVERALALLASRRTPRILDLGTGSGAIALALAHERPDAAVVATDTSTAALAVARANARALGLAVDFCTGDWYAALAAEARFDLIVSNPPYVERGDPMLQPAVARFEPEHALYAEQGGLAAFSAIVDGAGRRLRGGGHLVLEHGAAQGAQVVTLLERAGFVDVRDDCDLAGLPRVASGRWPGTDTNHATD
ncbi:MAG: peptide chain release factor N(5)-glutamine methyltransferase [Nevskiaceae bacterium]|nr:MAG: peptide chain release factor N(5)-glutamine methyltransferase [Nevskiaceae bacterium]TBR73599.1 MAG: peptide chain release factor N(5)-glutamine methyltransferase [Nevskiaceae bacterium]